MRFRLAMLSVLLALVIISSGRAVADVPDPGIPIYANKILGSFITPTVEPGESVDFAFNITNPYDDPNVTMTDIVLTMGIYRYVTQDDSDDVDDDFPHPPLILGVGIEVELPLEDLGDGDQTTIETPLETSGRTPHGSFFSQSTYFIRFKVDFRFEGNATHVVLQSKGFFTDEQWSLAVSFDADTPVVNRTYLKSIGVDGLIPDSSFGLKVPVPVWPLGVLVAGCVVTAFGAVYYFVMDKPGRYPRLEKRLYYLRGKLSELRGQLKDRLGK